MRSSFAHVELVNDDSSSGVLFVTLGGYFYQKVVKFQRGENDSEAYCLEDEISGQV